MAAAQYALDEAVGEAEPLDPTALAYIAAQLDGDQGPAAPALPSFVELTSALGLAADVVDSPSPALRLPLRVLQGSAGARELSLWKTWSDHAVHEVLTTEFVDALAATAVHLLPAAEQIVDDAAELPVVLELGAGSGVLAHHLRTALQGLARVVATDSGADRIRPFCARGHGDDEPPVMAMDAEAAVAHFRPSVVVVAWMPRSVGSFDCWRWSCCCIYCVCCFVIWEDEMSQQPLQPHYFNHRSDHPAQRNRLDRCVPRL